MRGVLFTAAILGMAQDSGWIDKCKTIEPSKADSIRAELGDLKTQTGLVRATRAILLEASRRGPKGEALIKALSAHFSKLGDKPDHRQALAAALASAGDEAFCLAMGHAEELLASGEDAAKLAEPLKKFKVRASDGVLASEEGSALAQIKKSTDLAEIEKIALKAACPELAYVAAILALKGGDVERAGKLLAPLKKWSPEHVEHLLDTLKQFKPCTTCKGTKQVVCQACNGTKKREIVCPECGGVGSIRWDPGMAKTPLREQNDKALGLPKDRSYCPSCLNRPEYKKQTVDCKACDAKGVVQCQRCRWQKVSIDAIGKFEPCKGCAGSGFMFEKIQHPCAFCKGLGSFLIPLACPDKKVGPVQ